MARTVAGLPAGTRLTDHISLGVLTTRFPLATVEQVLVETARASQRERDLPAHVMVYYAIALALYADVSTREVLRCLLEGIRWLGEPGTVAEPAGASGSHRRAPGWARRRWRRCIARWCSRWRRGTPRGRGIASGA